MGRHMTSQRKANTLLAGPSGRKRFSVTTTTTVYLGCTSVFATSTMGAYGKISARRVR